MELYKFSSSWDKFVFRCGLFFSFAAGAVLPTYAIVLGKIVEIFDPMLDDETRHDMIFDFIWVILLICVATYVTSYLGYALLQISAERLSFKLRAKYLSALMKQEVAFFEEQQIEALPSKLAEYFTHISEGSGEKMGQLISTSGATASGIVIGLIINPFYALAVLCYLPFATIII